MSQVVIVHKKTGEIRLCVNFRALNAVTIRDSFPLPQIEEALQAVKAAAWFTSFDLAHGYLQLAMDEADIRKTAFCAGSSGCIRVHLYAFWSFQCWCQFLSPHGDVPWGPAVPDAPVLPQQYMHFHQFH